MAELAIGVFEEIDQKKIQKARRVLDRLSATEIAVYLGRRVMQSSQYTELPIISDHDRVRCEIRSDGYIVETPFGGMIVGSDFSGFTFDGHIGPSSITGSLEGATFAPAKLEVGEGHYSSLVPSSDKQKKA